MISIEEFYGKAALSMDTSVEVNDPRSQNSKQVKLVLTNDLKV